MISFFLYESNTHGTSSYSQLNPNTCPHLNHSTLSGHTYTICESSNFLIIAIFYDKPVKSSHFLNCFDTVSITQCRDTIKQIILRSKHLKHLSSSLFCLMLFLFLLSLLLFLMLIFLMFMLFSHNLFL